jgi:hypothetical protein
MGRFIPQRINLDYHLVWRCTRVHAHGRGLHGQGNPVGWLRGRRWARLRHQYGNDGEPPGEDVIDDTISDEPLPNTGGVPLLGVGFFGFICIYAAFAVLRPVIRWDS